MIFYYVISFQLFFFKVYFVLRFSEAFRKLQEKITVTESMLRNAAGLSSSKDSFWEILWNFHDNSSQEQLGTTASKLFHNFL